MVAVPKSPRSILVTWADVPVEEQNGALTEYEILYEQSTLSEIAQSRSVRVGAGEEDEATLVDLEEFVEYMISVRAYNGDGGGPYSAPVSVTTYQDGRKLSVRLPVCLSVCVSICVSVFRSVCLSVCLSV